MLTLRSTDAFSGLETDETLNAAQIDQRARTLREMSSAGAEAGEEVVQLYVAAKNSKVERAPKEFKAFARVALAPREGADRCICPFRQPTWHTPTKQPPNGESNRSGTPQSWVVIPSTRMPYGQISTWFKVLASFHMDSHIHTSPSGSKPAPCRGSAQSRTFLELARLKAQSELK
jgi:hypothetical protein